MNFLGIEIGGTKLQVAIGDEDGLIIDRYRSNVDRDKGAEGIREKVEEACRDLVSTYQPVSVGVGFGGPVRRNTGEIAKSYQITGWDGFNLVEWVKDLTGLPVNMDNDANTAALGEACMGKGKEKRLVFYVTLGSGMGGGMVIDKKIYHGAFPGESELGLMPHSLSGGSMESHCCGWSVDRKVQAYINEEPKGTLARLIGEQEGGEARYLASAVQLGDEGAARIMDDLTSNLAFALAMPAHLFHPEMIVLGGGLTLIGEPLLDGVRGKLPGFMSEAFKPGPAVELAALGEDVVIIGALMLARQAQKI